MASDGLNQIGKHMKQTRRDVDHALDRYIQKRSRIERTRDVFSADLPFVMYFKTHEDETVTLNINFNKPPPGTSAFSVGSCDQFTLGTDDKIVTTTALYESGTLNVYVNGDDYPAGKWSEYDVDAQQVFVKGGTLATNVLVICYVRA